MTPNATCLLFGGTVFNLALLNNSCMSVKNNVAFFKDFNRLFRLRAHGGCDRSAEDAYSSMAPDPTLALSEVRVALHSILYIFFGL